MHTDHEKFWKELRAFAETVCQQAERKFDGSPVQQTTRCYFLKLQNTASSAMLLLDHLRVQDARILLRTLFENMVFLRASARKESFEVFYTKDWVRCRERHSALLHEYWEKRKNNEKQMERLRIGDEKTEAKKKSIVIPKGFSKKSFDIDRLVEEFELDEQHKLFYTLLHDEVHSLSTAVSFHQSEEGGISYPNLDWVDLTAMSIFWIYLFGIEDVINVFSLDHLKGRLGELDAKRQENEARDAASRGTVFAEI